MTRKNMLRLILRVGVAVLFLLYLLALVRPDFSPQSALERTQRRYGSYFTGEVYEVQADEKTTVYLGEMGTGYGLIAVESCSLIFTTKPGPLYREMSFYWIDDMEGMPVSSVQMWRNSDGNSMPRYLFSNQFSNAPGFFFGRVSDPEVVRVEVHWRDFWSPEDGEYTVSFTEFYDGLFFFPLGFRDDMGHSCEYILSAYDAAGELVFQDTYGDWNGDGVTHGDKEHTYYLRS
jgi:hypothetical protein